jgi:KDO2-lipid IV(A) lauroyltransferase
MLLAGKGLGLLTMHLLKSRRHITETNIRLCFPELDAAQVSDLARASYISLGQGGLSTGLAWWASDRRLRTLLQEVTGLEHLNHAFAKGRGVILLSAHFSAGDIGGYFSNLLCHHSLAVLPRQQSIDVFESVLQKGRKRYFNATILRANVRKMIRTLKSNGGIFYTPDQTFEREHSIFVPFMDVNALTITATSRIAKMNNCVVLPAFCFQRSDGKGFDMEFWPMLEDFPSGDDKADAIRINEILAKAIRSHPEQYMWQHRRFKVRPGGEEGLY